MTNIFPFAALVREGVARNAAAPAEVLAALARDLDAGVRSAVVRNPSILFEDLATRPVKLRFLTGEGAKRLQRLFRLSHRLWSAPLRR
jgi:hypothetical protein